MRIIEPSQFKKPLKKKRPLRGLVVVVLIILLAGYSALAYAKPLGTVQGRPATLSAAAVAPPSLRWPETGQAAFGAVNYGVLAESGAQTIAPMASIAKIMTALAVLQAKPLKPGEQGPHLTINDEDIASYDHYAALGGSVVAVNSGESISEYEALQGLLLPSGNNMADTLARWAYGSTDAYMAQAGKIATSLGMTQTMIADASGFSPLTKSTPHDLVLLGIAAMHNPVLAEIVGQTTATIPVAASVDNTNGLLGQSGINGIKTGNTDEAGGCLLFSANQTFSNGQTLTLIGAVMGTPTLFQAQRDSLSLLRSAIPGFRVLPVVRRQTVVGSYQTSWGGTARVLTTEDVSLLLWAAQAVRFKVDLQDIKINTAKHAAVGTVAIDAGGINKTLPVVLESSLSPPTASWRLAHFFKK